LLLMLPPPPNLPDVASMDRMLDNGGSSSSPSLWRVLPDDGGVQSASSLPAFPGSSAFSLKSSPPPFVPAVAMAAAVKAPAAAKIGAGIFIYEAPSGVFCPGGGLRGLFLALLAFGVRCRRCILHQETRSDLRYSSYSSVIANATVFEKV